MKVHHALKHVFIPHKGNDYKPHFFRELSIKIILFASIFLLGISAGSSFFIHKTVLGVSIASSVIVDLTNQNRLAYNESPLTINKKLEEAATLKAEDMISSNYFSHNSPTGVTPWHWIKQVGYEFLYAGENLAINFTDSNDVENAWLNSPTHKANLLNVNFQEIGIAVKEGMHNGESTIFVVQMFGTPLIATAATTSTYAVTEKSLKTSSSTDTTVKVAVIKNKDEINSNVMGTTTKTEEAKATDTIQKIMDTENFSIVKNTAEGTTSLSKNKKLEVYSKWYERLVFSGKQYVNNIYEFLIIFISGALFLALVIEMKRKHWKHILYGVLIVVILVLFICINNIYF